jgi:hypothetical protein
MTTSGPFRLLSCLTAGLTMDLLLQDRFLNFIRNRKLVTGQFCFLMRVSNQAGCGLNSVLDG